MGLLVEEMVASSKSISKPSNRLIATAFFVLRGYPGWTVFPDFTNPVSTEWWREQFSEFYKALEFDGVWIVSCYFRIKLLVEIDIPSCEMNVDPDL